MIAVKKGATVVINQTCTPPPPAYTHGGHNTLPPLTHKFSRLRGVNSCGVMGACLALAITCYFVGLPLVRKSNFPSAV